MTTLELTLPWPPSGLSPNARHSHWASLARAKKRFRDACFMTARTQGAQTFQAKPAGKVAVHLRFVPPDRRRRDLDNVLAAMKSGLDGLADAISVDDSRFALSADMPVVGSIGGFVRVTISNISE